MIFFHGRCKGIRIVCPWTNLMRAVQSLTCDRSHQGHPSKLAAILPWHLRQRRKYAGEIWKRTFVSTVRPTVRTNPYRKPSSNRINLKMPAFLFPCGRNAFWMRLFVHDDVTIIMWSPERVFFQHKSKMTGDYCVFKFPCGRKNIRFVFRVNCAVRFPS